MEGGFNLFQLSPARKIPLFKEKRDGSYGVLLLTLIGRGFFITSHLVEEKEKYDCDSNFNLDFHCP